MKRRPLQEVVAHWLKHLGLIDNFSIDEVAPGSNRWIAKVRVHKSAIVNLHHVRELVPLFKGDGEARLSNGATVPYSRRYRERLLECLGRV